MGLRGLSRLRRRHIEDVKTCMIREWGSTVAG